MTEQKRLNSYRAKLDFTILAHTQEEAEQLLLDLAKNLNRFDDLALVKGEME